MAAYGSTITLGSSSSFPTFTGSNVLYVVGCTLNIIDATFNAG
jgi:hypothetical protein